MGNPFAGFTHFFSGLRLIMQPGLRRFVLIPLGINIVIFAGLLWLAAGQFEALMEWLLPALPGWLAWLVTLLWLLFGALAALLVFFSFTLVANLIGAPFNGLLVEKHLTGQPLPEGSGLAAALKEAPGAIMDELGKLLYFALWAVPLLLLSLVPVVNVVAPFLWLLFTAWMMAVEYGDFPLGNHGMKGREIRATLRGKRLLSLGFGGTTLVATMIPVFNFLVMPTAVAGATAMWVREWNSRA